MVLKPQRRFNGLLLDQVVDVRHLLNVLSDALLKILRQSNTLRLNPELLQFLNGLLDLKNGGALLHPRQAKAL